MVASLVRGLRRRTRRATARRELVPSNALLYVHARVEPGGEQWRRAGEIVRRLPALRRLRDRALDSVSRGRRPLDFETQVRPWIGDEAAVALLPAGRRATSLILVRVADQPLARRFLAGAGDPTGRKVRRGTVIRVYGDLAAAFVGDFLAVGSLPNVRAAIDARGRRIAGRAGDCSAGPSTSSRWRTRSPTRMRPRAESRRCCASRTGLLGQVRALVDVPGLEAAAAAVRAEGNGVRAGPRDADRRRRAGSASSSRPSPRRCPPARSRSWERRDSTGCSSTLERLSGQDAAALPGLLGRFRRQLGPRRTSARSAARSRPLQGREAALFVTPPVNLPVVTLVVAGTTPEEAGDVLVALQPVLVAAAREPCGRPGAGDRPAPDRRRGRDHAEPVARRSP